MASGYLGFSKNPVPKVTRTGDFRGILVIFNKIIRLERVNPGAGMIDIAVVITLETMMNVLTYFALLGGLVVLAVGGKFLLQKVKLL